MECTCEGHAHATALDSPEVTRCIADGCTCTGSDGAEAVEEPVGEPEAAPAADGAEAAESPEAAPV